MGNPISHPNSLDLGLVPIGGSGSANFSISTIPSEASVTVQITNDTSNGRFKVSFTSYRLEVVHDPEIPGKTVKEWVEVGQTDGSSPLIVFPGEQVQVTVTYLAPTDAYLPHVGPPPIPPRLIPDTYTATLLIQGTTWDPASIALSVTLIQLVMRVSPTSVTVRQTQTVELTVDVYTVIGPDTDVSFSYRSPGLTMADATVHTAHLVEQSVPLHFSVAPDAPIGNLTVNVWYSAYNGNQTGPLGPITFTIVAGQVTVQNPGPLVVARGGDIVTDVNVTLQGGSTDITLTPGVLPPGVSMPSKTISVATNGSATPQLQFFIDAHAPVGKSLPLSINWSAYNGQETGTATTTMDIKHVSKMWTFSQFSAGEVDCKNASVTCFSDGTWIFRGNLHDNSLYYGDNYSVGFVFLFNGLGSHQEGELGAKDSGPSENANINQAGHDPRIEQNWPFVFGSGVTARLYVSDDLAQPFEDLVNGLVKDLEAGAEWVYQELKKIGEPTSNPECRTDDDCFSQCGPDCICNAGVCVPDTGQQ